jgi:hypothetical protein
MGNVQLETNSNNLENFLGIGETKANNTISNIANTAIRLSADSVSTCTVNASNEQLARMHGATIGDGNTTEITQSMKSVMKLGCEQASEVDVDMQQAVINAIKQEAAATGTDIGMSSNEANNTTTNISTLRADISMNSILESAMYSAQKQEAEITGVTIGNQNRRLIRQDMTQEMFMNAMMDAVKNNAFVQDAANKIDQKGEAVTKSTLVGILDSLTNMGTVMMVMIGLVFISLFVGIALVLSGDNGTAIVSSWSGGYNSTDYIGGKSEIMDYDY